ncbi:two-component response regulator [Bordetella ansorpii]|uniref:Two-component response regulator n=2 Tax=Bordetella ansorpii TaxID=288768 RepID=A0A157S4W8_9BORD|nr:two-component response regulator [Bordetella ansorpii]
MRHHPHAAAVAGSTNDQMKILVIDDEKKLAETLRRSLTENGYFVDIALDGASGLHLAYESQYDLIILDVNLPDMEGFEVLHRIRQNDAVPIMMLTARASLEDRVRGLEQGADDYLIKPFALSELHARVLAIKRRGAGADTAQGQNVLRVADLELDLLRRRVMRGRARIDLTAKEFGLLTFLMRRQGEVLSRLVLAEQVWDMNFNSNTNVVEVAIRRLRAKVDDPFDIKLLHTVRGMGYMLEHQAD